MHSMVQSKLHIIKAARKNNLFSTAIEAINRLHTMPSFPLALSHLVLNERLKCHLQESSNASNGELRDSSLHKALNDFVRINYKVLNREQYVRMMAIGGRILSKVNLDDDANRIFRTAAQLDNLNSFASLWMHWSDHLEKLFQKNIEDNSQNLVDSLNCIVEAARYSNEGKARKFIIRILWRYKVLASACNRSVREQAEEIMKLRAIKISASRWLLTNFIEQTEKSKSEEATTFEGLLLEIVGQLLKAHPPDIIYLNRLFNELGNYQELWIERTLRTAIDLRNTLLKFASANSNLLTILQIPDEMKTVVNNWLTQVSEDCVIDHISDFLDLKAIKEKALTLFRGLDLSQCHLIQFVGILNRFITLIKIKFSGSDFPRRGCWLRTLSPFLATFTNNLANIEIFIDVPPIKVFFCANSIYRFLSKMRFVLHGGLICRQIMIRAIHSYLMQKSYKRDNIQLHSMFSIFNHLLATESMTSRRLLKFEVPRLMPLENTLLSECPEDASSIPSLLEILNNIVCSAKLNSADMILSHYYERLMNLEGIDIQSLINIMTEMNSVGLLPADSLSRWFSLRYVDATHYYMLRKQMVLSFALYNAAEYLFYLKESYLDAFILNLKTGRIYSLGFVFDTTCADMQPGSILRPVPFRLSTNISHFFGPTVEGHFIWSVNAVTQCFKKRDVLIYVRPFLCDAIFENANGDGEPEYIAKIKKIGERILLRLDESLEAIQKLTEDAQSTENLARMDPIWHPWF
ncbi:unnamed protein product [Dracunculus medinensis]|uniref:FATC domain-containing protein n=1 Tax=Dracunculus medinensis TaxID=318479 RepID=A0A0N4UIB3_DRAME|nr:unnamed protein product [Dracunculus medinensis]